MPVDQRGAWASGGRAQFRGGPWLERLWRVTLSRQARGLAAFFKPVLPEVPELSLLGTPDALRPLLHPASGIILFTGPACCGKTTTATAFTSTLCARSTLRVRALQRVSEYSLDAGSSLLHAREGEFDLDAEIGLGVRAGVDLFFLGDLDPANLGAALKAADSGALVLACLRAGNMAGAFDRLFESCAYTERERYGNLLAQHLRVVVLQYLLPDREHRTVVPAWEILCNNAALASAVRNGEWFRLPQILRAGVADGMLPLDESLAQLVHNNRILSKDAARIAFEPGRFA